MPSKIVIFCGKGGVGKTTISLAVALKHAVAGKRVLVVTSHPLPELATAVSMEGLGAQYPAAVKNLFIVHLDAAALLKDVVDRSFPVSTTDEKLVRTAIFRNLVEAAPGLKSFYFLARLQELAERESQTENAPQYEFLIWDTPATGHFLSTLRAARKFEYSRGGPLAEAGADVAQFFSNIQKVSVVPVTTLEEMAIEETLDLAGALERDFRVKGTRVVMNMASPLASANNGSLQAIGQFDDPALQFIFDRGRLERERAESLAQKLGIPAVTLPQLIHPGSDLAMLDRMAGMLDFAAGA
jgi:anion-transporting  ArsA/GET3 family ATPase